MNQKRGKTGMHELSRPMAVEKITASGTTERIVASAAERKALAERFGFGEIRALTAELEIRLERNRLTSVTGHVEGDVVQSCVITLDPVVTHVREPIEALYAPAHMVQPHGGESSAGAEEDEEPEPIIGGTIDLGELVAQHFALAVDPYPRKPGAELPESFAEPDDYVEPRPAPLAGLDSLKDRFGKK